MAAAIALASRGRGLATPNPNVGCVLVRDGKVLGRGWTQAGGRPHAEAMALDQAGDAARGGTAYVTLEPCAHESPRGGACTDALIAAGIARVVAATRDPDPRTNGAGLARLEGAGIAVTHGVLADDARAAMAGWWTRAGEGRPHVTLKLAMSLDGCIAMASGESRWITGARARAYAHLLRARSDAILVGRGTWAADAPALDVRLAGLEERNPRRLMLTSGRAPDGWTALSSPRAIADLDGVGDLLVEGGAGAAAAFFAADLVDTLILIRAPIVIGGGRGALEDIGLEALGDAHGRWRLAEAQVLGQDSVETYRRVRGG
ncbi:MAG: bifunctional diaminohydroxyphosphoribosylaminopyrimidine deaminase/5-amino-6-(5-phosphoribosylamino)uracil reductase RibD [Sphingopyxis sp.]